MLAYRPLFWNSDCAVFLCHRQRRHWRHRLLTARRNEVIYNGIDTTSFRLDATQGHAARLRAQLGFEAGDFVIGLPALLRPEKNHVQLVEAVAQLRSHGVAARALLIGDGMERAHVEQRARALGVSDRVRIAGLQADVRPWIAACDVVTLCSTTEAFSLAALEAMSMERPVVLSDVGGASEMVVPGWNGLLFPVGDTSAYVNALLRLADRGTAERMGRNARIAVEQLFTAEAMTDRYEGLLCGLCGREPAPRPEMVVAGNS
jgi:glycosyltransferase involved in cell wall biosynthesis